MKFKHLINCSIIFSASNSFNLTSDPHSLFVFSVPPQKQPMRKMNTGHKFLLCILIKHLMQQKHYTMRPWKVKYNPLLLIRNPIESLCLWFALKQHKWVSVLCVCDPVLPSLFALDPYGNVQYCKHLDLLASLLYQFT